jgi:hypothetical protein
VEAVLWFLEIPIPKLVMILERIGEMDIKKAVSGFLDVNLVGAGNIGWLTCRSLVGNSDCVWRRKTGIGLLLECSLQVLHDHGPDASLATGTTRRR